MNGFPRIDASALVPLNTFFAFLHGFSSDSEAGGGGFIASAASKLLNIPIERPNLNYPSFEEFTVTSALGVMDRLYETKKKEMLGANNQGDQVKVNLIGASMGGYIAARWAELHPERVNKLFLLCPAFELASHWSNFVKQEQLDEWKRTNKLAYGGYNLHYKFFEDGQQNHPLIPKVKCPVVIIHGRRDPIIPIQSSRNFLKAHETTKNVRLVEVDDDHYLSKSVFVLIQQAQSFFLSP